MHIVSCHVVIRYGHRTMTDFDSVYCHAVCNQWRNYYTRFAAYFLYFLCFASLLLSLKISSGDEGAGVLAVTYAERKRRFTRLGRSEVVLRLVRSRSRLNRRIARHRVTTSYAVLRQTWLVQVRIDDLVRTGSRCVLPIFGEATEFAAA